MRIAFLIFWCVLFAPRAAAASPLPELDGWLRADRLRQAAPGAWAEYATLVGGHPVGPWLRFTVIQQVAGEGSWIELWISQRPGSATQAYRILLGERGVRRVVARVMGGQSRELPLPQEEGRVRGGPPPAFSPVRRETLQTEAGTLQATRIEARGAAGWSSRAWVTEEVPVFGLARLELANGSGLILHGSGTAGRGVVELPAEEEAR